MTSRLGLVRCKHCGRQFNPHSAARHIPWCAKQQATLNRRPKLSSEKREAFERYKWRINYRPSNQIQESRPVIRNINNNNNNSSSSSKDYRDSIIGLSRYFPNQQQNKHNIRSSLNSSPSASSSNSTRTSYSSQKYPSKSGTNKSKATTNSKNVHVFGGTRSRPVDTLVGVPRSVSSLTLVRRKQDNFLIENKGEKKETSKDRQCSYDTNDIDLNNNYHHHRLRAKSIGDLRSMNQVVEMLAKRVDEIYILNKKLLENLQDKEDNINILKCHHCKTVIFNKKANYCQECGCKLILNSGIEVEQEGVTSGSVTALSSPDLESRRNDDDDEEDNCKNQITS